MIDLHTHILPYVDDGAVDLDMALDMGRRAAAHDITVVAATPHFFQIPDWAQIQKRVDDLQQEFDKHGIGVRLVSGSELFIDLDIMEMPEHQIPTYGNQGKYCLLELPLQQVPIYTEQVIFSLQTKGITPIIAHPERYLAVTMDPNLVFSWIELGCAIQMNSGSILGHFGQRILRTAKILLTHGMVHILASDAHSLGRREINTQEAFEAVAQVLDVDSALKLVNHNPELVLSSKPLPLEGASEYRKRKKFWFFGARK